VRWSIACGSVLAMSASVVSPVFIGRRDEMALLAAPVRRAQGGEPAVVLIGGEAGVGKTRLVGELAALGSAAGFCVLTGQCIELGAEGLPLAPLVDVLRALARDTPPGELVELLGPGLARLLLELAPAMAAPAAGEGLQAGQLLELVLGLLERRSTNRSTSGRQEISIAVTRCNSRNSVRDDPPTIWFGRCGTRSTATRSTTCDPRCVAELGSTRNQGGAAGPAPAPRALPWGPARRSPGHPPRVTVI
jgi:hypothetical protein